MLHNVFFESNTILNTIKTECIWFFCGVAKRENRKEKIRSDL